MKQWLTLLAVILSIPSVFACATSDQLEAQAADCADSGKYAAHSYDTYGCKYVTCTACSVDIEAAVSKCKSAGLDYSTYLDEKSCKQVRCLEIEVDCLSNTEIEESRQHCRDQDLPYYSKYNTNDCEYVVCGSSACQSDSNVDAQTSKCKEYGKSYETFKDNHGCGFVKCVEATCPDITESAEKCMKAGLKALYSADSHGCKQVKCGSAQYQCKKVMESDCTLISCTDGYEFNSCENACLPSIAGKTRANATTARESETAQETIDDLKETEGFFARLFKIFG